MSITTTARNASLDDLRTILQDQHARKIDMVAPATQFSAQEGLIRVDGLEPIIEADGVTDGNGLYRPTEVFDEGLAGKLNIPLAYVRRMRAERPDLYDANVNGWLHGRKAKVRFPSNYSGPLSAAPVEVVREATPADPRSFMLRTFRGEDGQPGVARALLSNSYAIMDNLDALVAALDGVRQAGVNVQFQGADLTDRRMYVRIIAPEVQALAPTLLERYRSPFSGATGKDNPTVFAGFVISNSETGGGAFTITPRLVVQVCSNGMTITKDALRAVHLGGRLEDSVIRWSDDTQRKDLALVTARARDAVKTFLDVDYMRKVITDLEIKAGKPFTNADEALKVIGKKLAFDQETQDAVFSMFVQGADMTAGGVLHAVTAAAQQVEDADKASDIEAAAFRAFELAYSMGA